MASRFGEFTLGRIKEGMAECRVDREREIKKRVVTDLWFTVVYRWECGVIGVSHGKHYDSSEWSEIALCSSLAP